MAQANNYLNPRSTSPDLTRIVFLSIMVILMVNCSGSPLRPSSEERLLLQNMSRLMGPEYTKPRLVHAELEVSISNIQVDEEIETGKNSDPTLLVWSANPLDISVQQLQSDVEVSPDPTAISLDDEYGNEIVFWDILDAVDSGAAVVLKRQFKYITFDYRPEPTDSLERQAWSMIPPTILARYTRPEEFLEQDDALVDTVFTLLESTASPVAQARVIYDWVQDHMNYVYPPEGRGVRYAFGSGAGDCGQYSALFITMARIAGIPARQQSGFNFHPDRQGAHVWSEIYLPVKGWVPVDATREDGFLHLDNQRLIMSRGLNIPLEQAPEWATYENSEVQKGCTDFMQMYTLVKRGVEADFHSSRRILRSVEL